MEVAKIFATSIWIILYGQTQSFRQNIFYLKEKCLNLHAIIFIIE